MFIIIKLIIHLKFQELVMNIKSWSPNWLKREQQNGQLAIQQRDIPSPVMKLHQEINRLFDEVFTSQDFSMPDLFGQETSQVFKGMLRPVVDIAEKDRLYVITAEIPGVEEKDIHLDLEGDTLIISGEKQQSEEHKNENYHRIERSYGTFQRVLTLPEDARPDSIKARFKDGVLTVDIGRDPEKSKKKGHHIPIEH
jgi:HSP20 family protein